MDKIAQAAQDEMDRQILAFVRGMEQVAPVQAESVLAYLVNHARIRATERQVCDRVSYLVSAGYLADKTEWDGGEVRRFEITALGMDLLDGKVPPRNWRPESGKR